MSKWNSWTQEEWAAANPAKPPPWPTYTGTPERWRELVARRGRSLRAGPAPSRLEGRSATGWTLRVTKDDIAAERRSRQGEALHEAQAWLADVVRETEEAERRGKKAEARESLLSMARVGHNPDPNPWQGVDVDEFRSTSKVVKVVREPRVYEQGSGNTWVHDLAADIAASNGFVPIPGRQDFNLEQVRANLKRYEQELRWEVANGTVEGKRIESCVRDTYRARHGTSLDFSNRDILAAKGTRRAVTTGTASMGDFVPPEYIVPTFSPFRTPNASLASQGTRKELGETGMKFYYPRVTSVGLTMGTVTENTDITQSTPTAVFATATVHLLAGRWVVSQQLFDRLGPRLNMTELAAQQASLQAATKLDTIALTAVLATASALTDSGTAGYGTFSKDVAKAASTIETATGSTLSPTHVFGPSAYMRFLTRSLDKETSPIFGPTGAAMVARSGAVDSQRQGYVGYDDMGLQLFVDMNIPAAGTNSQLLVGNAPEGLWVALGPVTLSSYPVPRATQLSVVITARRYCAVALPYGGSAWVKLSGAAFPKTPSTL